MPFHDIIFMLSPFCLYYFFKVKNDNNGKGDNMKRDIASELNERRNNSIPTKEVYLDGIGTGKLYGTINVEKLIRRLLKSEYISG